jgi:hypothetical protein
MIQAYRKYISALDELFVIAEDIQKCTDLRRLPHLVFLRNEMIKELKMLRSNLNQKESELFVNGEDYKVDFNKKTIVNR